MLEPPMRMTDDEEALLCCRFEDVELEWVP
jgi:hypothetical protein